jgi:hypothetical protein
MGPAVDPQRADQGAINLFHPVYHAFTYPIGCRIDIERLLPVDLEDEDQEELIDNFSEPPVWVERFSPLAAQVGDQIYRGRNASDLMLKIYRLMFDLFQGVGRFIESTIQQNMGEPVRYPFLSLAIDPDTLHRLIEADYESGDTTYSNLMKMFAQGTISPCVTTPFHAILPALESEHEIRLCVRSAFIFYLRILRIYHDFLARNGEEGLMVIPFWLPEGGYSQRTLEILEEEFLALCKREKFANAHLVLLMDNHQACYRENDVLMKSWNIIQRPEKPDAAPVRSRKSDKHEVAGISVMFRDRSFSDWVIHANPSVKKLLDRTIAKVDSDINSQNVHYGWAHFEELEAITYTPRAIVNFQQKLIKLTELGYLPLSPEFYVRGKIRGEFGVTTHEPQQIELKENSVGNGWNLEDATCQGRFSGLRQGEQEAGVLSKSFERPGAEGKITENGNGGWKIAWHTARRKIHQAVVGDLETLKGGMAEVLAELTGQTAPDKIRRNVHDFLAHYTYVYWREHFIQHDLAEADINVQELANKHLRAGVKAALEPTEVARAGAAAQAIYFCLHASASHGVAWENMDQRGFYQNVMKLTLSICNAMYVYHWMGDNKSARKLLNLLKTELLEFDTAFERYNLTQFGVSATQWKKSLRSEVEDSKDNIVKRAALRVAARHLRPLGYAKEFTRADANITTNCGHIWSIESCRENFCYENSAFCGVNEQ